MDQGNEPSILDIAPNGDVILVVDQDAAQKKLRVHSFALSMASKVFAAMFGSQFAEGQRLNSTYPKDVPLPEDDADAMVTICSVLHYRYELIKDHLNIDTIYDIAVCADKYEFTGALKPSFQIWMSKTGDVRRTEPLLKAMTAAYIFDDADIFHDISRSLVEHSSDDYAESWDWSASGFLPAKALGNMMTLTPILATVTDKIIVFLTDQRNKLRIQIRRLLFGEDAAMNYCNCNTIEFNLGAYIRSMRRNGFEHDITEKTTCAHIIEMIREYQPSLQSLPEATIRFGCDSRYHPMPDIAEYLSVGVKALNAKGMCLDCIRADGYSKPERCRGGFGTHLPGSC